MPAKRQALRKTLVHDASAAVETCAGWNSRLVARRITNFLDKEMEACGLSISQFGLMAQIAAASDDSLGALAERTGLDQSTLSRNLRTLEAAELVEIAIADADQRRRVVWLTEAGARRLETAIPVWRRANAALGKTFDPRLVRSLAQATADLERDKRD